MLTCEIHYEATDINTNTTTTKTKRSKGTGHSIIATEDRRKDLTVVNVGRRQKDHSALLEGAPLLKRSPKLLQRTEPRISQHCERRRSLGTTR